jgi:hypothetical protein
MTVTLTREEAQELFDVVEAADKVLVTAAKFGGNPKKGYVTILIKDYAEVSLNLRKQLNKIETLRARLSAPEPEPVAWLDSLDRSQPHAVTGFQYLTVSQLERGDQHKYIPVYAAPQQREWQGLTDEEVDEAAKERWVAKQSFEAGAWWANERLKDKNT